MLSTTMQAVRSILTADPSVNPQERARLLSLMRQGSEAQKPHIIVSTGACLMRRHEVAERMSVSLRTVDKLAATGLLHKRTLPGRVRASGFLAADVEALILGQGGAL